MPKRLLAGVIRLDPHASRGVVILIDLLPQNDPTEGEFHLGGMVNTSALKDLLERVLKIEDARGVQNTLDALQASLNNMAASPGNAGTQSAFSDAFKNFKTSMQAAQGDLTPGDMDDLEEILSEGDFSNELVEEIEQIISDNPATPAVARDKVAEVVENRSIGIDNMRDLLEKLEFFGVQSPKNSNDQGQVGFTVPRNIFDNEFNNLIVELSFIKRLVRIVAESQGLEGDKIELGQISTSDPIIWLIVSFGVAKGIGSLTSWALDTWKKVEDIRHVRAQTAKLSSFSQDEVSKIFDDKIIKAVANEVSAKASSLVEGIFDDGRRNELENGLNILLGQFLARIERGLRVDIKYLPSIQGGKTSEEVERKLAEIKEIVSQFKFLQSSGEPILAIEAANDLGAPPIS